MKAIENPSVIDFEDGLEYYSALDEGCECIVTQDLDDFYFSNIPIMNCEQFFKNYLREK